MSIAAQCPNCGAQIAFHVGSSIVTVCEHCRTVVARTDRAFEDLGKTSDLVQTRSPLALWMAGRYQGVGFQLTGRAQIRHSAGGVWDEWYMAFDDGRWGWLAEAQGRFYLTFHVPRTGRIDPAMLVPGHSVQVGDPPVFMVVQETGEAELLAGRGEIPYRFEPGQRYWYADLSGQGNAFATLDFSEDTPSLYMGRQVALDELGIDKLGIAATDHDQAPGQGPRVASVSCQNCGGSLELHAPDSTERVACPYCGAMHDCNHGVLQFLKMAEGGPKQPAIPLGAKGRFEDESFTVIGFMCRSIRAQGEIYPWEEYLLYHPRLGFRWLVQSDGHFTYVEPISIADVGASVRPDGHHYEGELAAYRGKDYKVFQSGEPRVDYVAGEFYWRVEQGQVSATVDYVHPPEMLSAEATDSEINWSLGTYMTGKELARRFDATLDLPRPSGVAPNQPFAYKSVYAVWGLFLAAILVAGYWAYSRADNRPVFSQTFSLAPQTGQNPAENVYFGQPFQLAGGKNIKVRGYSNHVSNSWMYISADLYNQESGRVYAFDIPIEYYFGVEGGERWSEGSPSTSRYLSAVPAGSYALRIAVERSDSRRPSSVSIAVVQGVFRWQAWVIALVFISLIPVGVIIYNIVFEHRRWVQSDYAGGDE